MYNAMMLKKTEEEKKSLELNRLSLEDELIQAKNFKDIYLKALFIKNTAQKSDQTYIKETKDILFLNALLSFSDPHIIYNSLDKIYVDSNSRIPSFLVG
jgi:hypothetical protein